MVEHVSIAIEVVTSLLTLAGIVYGVLALWGARAFAKVKPATVGFAPGVSVLKPLKGADAKMYAGFVSHCEQVYAGEFEILFGVSSLSDEAVAYVARLRVEHPQAVIRLIECPERLGANGKVSSLMQVLPEAKYEHVVVNDADIVVPRDYLTKVMACFGTDSKVGLVTAPYIGAAEGGLWSRLEALGISTDFMPGVLTARKLEGGIKFGLGSTLATTKTVLAKIGGFASLVDKIADDYEMGARTAAAGYRVELTQAVVQTGVPRYSLRGYAEHQLRWARSTRDSRRGGYVGLGVTYVLPWALACVVASGGALWSFSLLSLALVVRVAVALTVGVGILRDGQVLRDFLLIPLRDFFGLYFWVWSYASDVVVWRGEKFTLRRGEMKRIDSRQ